MRRQTGFTLIELLVVLAIFVILTAGGVVVWEKKVSPTPTPTPTINKEPTPTLIPSEAETTKMPWENSVCGNGICERCESRSECCNYPCVTDPISGNQMCPPPTCLGWCPQDCQDGISCQTDSDCPQSNVLIPKCLSNRCVYVKDTKSLQSCLEEANQARKRVCEEMNIPLDEYGNCVGVDFVKDPYQECYDKYGQ